MFSASSRRVSTLQRQETTPSVGLQIEVVGAGGGILKQPAEIFRADATPAGDFVESPGVRFARIAGEGRTEGDDETHQLRRQLGELARIESAEAPANNADRAAMLAPKRAQRRVHTLENALAQPEVDALAPADRGVAARTQETTQNRGARVARGEPRQHQDGMPVPLRGGAPYRSQRDGGIMFPQRPDLEQLQEQTRGLDLTPGRRSQRAQRRIHANFGKSAISLSALVKHHGRKTPEQFSRSAR